MEVKALLVMPFDRVFETATGCETCHATGYEVSFAGEWWIEYVDSTGELYYGR